MANNRIYDQKFLNAVIDSIPEPVFIKDAESRYVIVNEAALQVFSLSRDQIIGKLDLEMFPKELACRFVAEDQEALETGSDSHEKTVTTLSGVKVFFTKKKVIKSVDGQRFIIGVIHDITNQRKEDTYLKATKEALDESQSIAKLGTWSLDFASRKLWWSDQMYRTLGFTRGEFIPTIENTMVLIHPDAAEASWKNYNDMIEGRADSYSMEVKMRRSDGSYVYTMAMGRIIRSPDGSPLRMLGTTQDISGLKEREIRLREMSDRLRLALKAANLGFWEIDVPTNTLTVSEESVKMFQLKKGVSVLDEYISRVHPDDLQQVLDSDLVKASARKEIDSNIAEAANKFRIILPDGEIRHITSIGAIYRDSEGNPLRLVGLNADITDSVKLEIDLAHQAETLTQEASYATFMAEVGEIINMTHTSSDAMRGVLQSVCKYTGWSAGHVMIKNGDDESATLDSTGHWFMRDPSKLSSLRRMPESVSVVEEGSNPARVAGGIPMWDDEVTKEKNPARLAAFKKAGIKSSFAIPLKVKEEVVGLIEFFNETVSPLDEDLISKIWPLGVMLGRVIERKRYAAQRESDQKMLEQASRYSTLGELASNIAHEINTPLATVSVDVRRIQRAVELGKELDSTKFLPICERTLQTVNKISDIIIGMKSLTRGPDDHETLVPVSLSATIQQTLAISKKKLSDHGIRIDIENQDTTQSGMMIMGVPIQMFQVLVNLLNNAVDALGEDTDVGERWIKISLKENSGNIDLGVENSGMRIPNDIAKRAFERHFTTKDLVRGTGLGLHLCRQIVALHNGSVFIDPSCKNTKFIVSIPKASQFEIDKAF